MKKIKRILACAVFADEHFSQLLAASLYATVVIPVLLWAYSFIYRLLKEHFHRGGSDEASSKS